LYIFGKCLSFGKVFVQKRVLLHYSLYKDMGKIIVVGSSNVDLSALVSSLPRPGETIGGAKLIQANGGKGANQAVAAGRLGGDVTFLTCVGDDSHGHGLQSQFEKDGIDTSLMKFTDKEATGVALIYIDSSAENCIAVAPGANNELLPEDIDNARQYFEKAEYLLVQLEIRIETVERAVSLAKQCGMRTILNPAPMAQLSDDLLNGLWLITPNETEAEKLTGISISNQDDAVAAAAVLLSKGVQNVIVTLGSAGSIVCQKSGSTYVPGIKVNAVDTVGAGDVYNGALVTALSEGKSLTEAAGFATAASAISVTRTGAQTSVPFRNEVDITLKTF